MKNTDFLYDLFIKCNFVHNRETTPEWGFDIEKSGHNNLVLVYGGNGVFESNGESRCVSRGDLIFFRRGNNKIMKTNADDLLKLYTVNFQYTMPLETDGEWELADTQLPIPFCTHINDEELFARLSRLFERLCRIHPVRTSAGYAEERAVFTQILELALLCGERGAHLNYRVKAKIDSVIEYMSENCSAKINVASLASRADMSTSHFCAMFKKITGAAPIEYLLKLRISKAKPLLEDGMSVGAVAEKVGFADIYYFSNMFKKIEGVSPTRYLRENMNKL